MGRKISMALSSLLPNSRKVHVLDRSGEIDPFLAFRREMNRLFDDAFGRFGLPSVFGHMPMGGKLDVSETERDIRITAELPGVNEDGIEVVLDDDRLIIRGEIKQEHDNKNRDYRVRERVQVVFSRTLPLPFIVDPSRITAKFGNSTLTVTISKPTETGAQHAERASATSVSGLKDVFFSEDEIEAAAAFETASTKLLKVAEETLAEVRQDNEKTRAILARLEAELAPHA